MCLAIPSYKRKEGPDRDLRERFVGVRPPREEQGQLRSGPSPLRRSPDEPPLTILHLLRRMLVEFSEHFLALATEAAPHDLATVTPALTALQSLNQRGPAPTKTTMDIAAAT